ncbi:MAG: threonine aldolase [Planctomycetaceae bacterium]|nr:threonine aldolase [Planctomycetaceae bacterium]
MKSQYHIEDSSQIITPALVVFRDLVEANLRMMIAIAGDAHRLRPHCKTHKMREVVEMQLSHGIVKHKCATFAEAEMLATTGVQDIFLAYNLVGPNIARAVDFRQRFSDVTLSVTADHADPIQQLGQAMAAAGTSIEVLLDIDTGQHRTGLPVGETAAQRYQQIAQTDGLIPGGLHVYDGQNHQVDIEDRRRAVTVCWDSAASFRDELVRSGHPVPRIVAGGTGSFPIFSEISDATIELSPGTCVFHDTGYEENFPDLEFQQAALVLTRVISRPTSNRVTFDLGYKGVASDPPAGCRVSFPGIPDAVEVLQNEEHLVIETTDSEHFSPGSEQLTIPRHICPTSALHKQAYVVAGGKVEGTWIVAARDRQLTI